MLCSSFSLFFFLPFFPIQNEDERLLLCTVPIMKRETRFLQGKKETKEQSDAVHEEQISTFFAHLTSSHRPRNQRTVVTVKPLRCMGSAVTSVCVLIAKSDTSAA